MFNKVASAGQPLLCVADLFNFRLQISDCRLQIQFALIINPMCRSRSRQTSDIIHRTSYIRLLIEYYFIKNTFVIQNKKLHLSS